MALLLLSFIAGILTVLSPCVFTILPIILGSSTTKRNPITIIYGLAVSTFLFTLLLRVSTLLIGIPTSIWQDISGIILILVGLTMVFPGVWGIVEVKLGLNKSSNELLQKASMKEGSIGDFLVGAALGPIFTSCSPTYGLIVAQIIPASLISGVIYLLVYIGGLSLFLYAIAKLGQRLVSAIKWAANPDSTFRKIFGGILIAMGILVIFGITKEIESTLIQTTNFNLTNLEISILDYFKVVK